MRRSRGRGVLSAPDLTGRTIWLIGGDGFVRGYVRLVLDAVGARIVTLPRLDRDAAAAPDLSPAAAILDLSPGTRSTLIASEALADRDIPFLLLATPRTPVPALLRSRPLLVQPFASSRLLAALQAIVAADAPLSAPRIAANDAT